jgi:hypothetical protein
MHVNDSKQLQTAYNQCGNSFVNIPVAGFSQMTPDLKIGKSHGTFVQLRDANGDVTNRAEHTLPTSAVGCGFFKSRKSVPIVSLNRIDCSHSLAGTYQSA